MKSLFSIVATILLVTVSTPSEAITAEFYLSAKNLSAGNDEAAKSSRLAMKAYEQGLAEAFWLMAMANSNKIVFSKNVQVCVPSPDVLTGEIVSAGITRMIGTPANPKTLSPVMKDLPLGALAFTGLAQIFPCSP